MDPVERIARATEVAAKVVNGVRSDQLSNPTPCTELDVRGLLNHIMGGLEMARDAASGGSPAMPSGDQFGADPGKEYVARRAKLLEAIRQPGALDRGWKMPFGELPGQVMAGIAFMEHLTHAWDLAKATGQDSRLPPDLVDECMEVVTPMEAMLRLPGVCGPAIPVPDDASDQDKLIAFMGRQP